MTRNCGAFSLIELLVATSISVLLIALVAGTMMHTSRTAAITSEILAMHDNASAISRVLTERLEAQQPNTSWHLLAGPGLDGAWGTGDETCSLSFMASSPDRSDRGGGFKSADLIALDWYRLTWTGPDADGNGSTLTWASTGGGRGSPDYIYSASWARPWPDTMAGGSDFSYRISIVPEPRRDRRRDLDDNDLRLIAGMSPALYTHQYDTGSSAGPLPGDSAALDMNANRLVHPTTVVSSLSISWVDRAGWETRFDPALGIVRRTDSGAAAPAPPGAPWLRQNRVSLDGVFVDARPYTLAQNGTEPADSRDVGAARPAIIRIAFTLRRPPPPEARSRDPIEQRFSFAIPLQPGLPRPTSNWPLGIP